MAGLQAEKLMVNVSASDVPVVFLHREEDSPLFLASVADALAANKAFSERKVVGLLTAADPNAKGGSFYIVGPAELVKSLGNKVAAVMEGRGGGRPGRFQGKANRIDLRDEALGALRRSVSA